MRDAAAWRTRGCCKDAAEIKDHSPLIKDQRSFTRDQRSKIIHPQIKDQRSFTTDQRSKIIHPRSKIKDHSHEIKDQRSFIGVLATWFDNSFSKIESIGAPITCFLFKMARKCFKAKATLNYCKSYCIALIVNMKKLTWSFRELIARSMSKFARWSPISAATSLHPISAAARFFQSSIRDN